MKKPTMKDVARAADTSVMTVSRAFKADASVGETTRARILQAAEQLGYVFDRTAANLRSQRSHFVAVTIPSLNNANFAETVEGITAGLAPHDLQVLLGYTNYDITREEQLIEELLRRRPEAIIVTGGRHTDRARRLLAGAGIPVVETWDLPSDPVEHVVGFSNSQMMELMVAHMVEQGREKLAFIGGDSSWDTRGADRRRGFIAAMQARGLRAERLIAFGPPTVSMKSGAEAMVQLLDLHPDTDGVICVSDLAAFGALTECQRRGIDVPGQIAVAGFGAYDIADVSYPTLTTIDPSPTLIGTKVAELVADILRGAGTLPPPDPILPVLRIGGSTRRGG